MSKIMECIGKDFIPVEHEEEILVLKSVFDDDFVSIDNEDHLSTFDLIIRFDSLPNKLLLIHEESNVSTELSHLPPITLRITYQQTYPTIDPPLYRILCDYLTYDQLFLLANQMDSMWNPGEVIVYKWIELLKDYFYNLSNRLIVCSTKLSINDKRFSTNYDKNESRRVYEQLIEYNRMQNQFEFQQTNHICPICLQEQSGKTCLQFEKCHHFACVSCLNSYAIEYLCNIQQNKQISCYECNASLFLSELRRMFSDDKLLLKYQQHLLEQTVDMVWCPRCHHSIICIPSESTSGNHLSFVECLHCEFVFCRRCEENWHPQIQCPKEKILQSLVQNSDQNQPQLKKIDIAKLLLEIDTVQMIEKCSKPCPSCGVRIEKNGGCQHMNCQACRIHFCWECGWYGNSYGAHPCQRKPEKLQASLPSDINAKVEQILHDEYGKRIRHVITKRVQICPRENCREVHVKIGTNNMLICEKCGNNFCFLCGEAIYGKFHFSKYGCKEDTRI